MTSKQYQVKYVSKPEIDWPNITKLLHVSTEQNRFSNGGPVKRLLEKKIHTLLGLSNGKDVLCLSNGTAALRALMWFYEKKCGAKRWLTPSYTFPAVVVGGINYKIVDIEENYYTAELSASLLSDVDGVVITNLFGTIANIEAWEALCKAQNKILIIDNASSSMSRVGGKNICEFGDAAFSSLHHTKYMGFGEGGFVVIDAEYYAEVEAISNFGYFYNSNNYHELSSNLKMSDISAAFVLSHIERYSFEQHMNVQKEMVNLIGEFAELALFNYTEGVFYGNLPILFDTTVNTDFLDSCGIEARKYYRPLQSTPKANSVFNRMINLPLHADIDLEQISHIRVSIQRMLNSR